MQSLLLKYGWLLVLVTEFASVKGHGRLMDPPQRSSMWRFGFNVPPNYQDNELYCGGLATQYNDINQGRCGECGDEWSLPRPRPNDEGGMYGTGIIGKIYGQGQIIPATVQLTASHKGWFEFRICKKSSAEELVTQECLNNTLLALEDGSTQFPVPTYDTGNYYPRIQLPPGLTCDHCVLQWWYRAGNNWGPCDDGTSQAGCGNQETFVNCADIAIY